MNLNDLLRRKRAAQARIDDPVWQEAFAACRDRAHRDFATSHVGASDIRERAYHRLCALDAVEAELATMVADYDLAKHRADRAEEL